MRSPLLLAVAPLLGACTWIGPADFAERVGADDTAACPTCGRTIAEALPDQTTAEMEPGTSTLVAESLVAQEAGVASAIGVTDTVNGTIVLDPDHQGWNGTNDSDAFTLHVPADARVRLTASWPDATADLDFGIWYDDESLGFVDLFSSWGPGSCLAGDAPSECVSDYVLLPETPYELIALGYLGTEDQPYTITLEWLAP
jgi:hypothetical protein